MWMLRFRIPFISCRTNISCTLMKLSLTKFTPTEREFDQGNIRENDIFTAPSRFWKCAEEKMIQILSSRYGVSQALSHIRVHLIKESKLRAVEVLENLILYCVYIFRTLQNFGRLYFWTVFGRNWNRAIFFARDAIIPGQTEFWFGKLVIILIKS